MSAHVTDHSEGEKQDGKQTVPSELIGQAEAAVVSTGASEQARSRSNSASPASIEDAPAPLYSKVYGQLDLHQNGLNTVANVADDGRLDIKITDDSRAVANGLVNALRKQLDNQLHRQRTDVASNIATEGSGHMSKPPALNIVIQVVGSRGDVQPFVALGKELKADYGHRVRLATHSSFRNFVIENGLEFFSIGGDPSELMAFMVKNPGLMPGKDALRKGEIGKRRKGMYEIIQGCWRSCFEAGDGTGAPVSDAQVQDDFNANDKPFVADAIIANPPSFAHMHCAEKMGIPLHLMFTMPWSPTQSFPHPLANIQASSTDASVTNFLSYVIVELMTWQGLGDIVNRFREKTLGLEPLSLMWAPGMANRLRIPYTYCWSPSLIPKPKDWASHISISGFYFLSLAGNYQPEPELAHFLASGAAPVYIGFGSIVVDDPNAMTKLIFDAVKRSGQRALVSKGWGGFGVGSLSVPDNIFMLGNVPHDWLFRHVSCVVHHGGAGTTAAGIALGKPTVVVPFFGDQPFWGAMVARAGAGPEPIHNKSLNAANLADAIKFALDPAVLERAKILGSKIALENGTQAGATSFHGGLELGMMRCSLSPMRAAVWTVKGSNIRLSACAATVLANSRLLSFGDLQLHRPKEYDTEDAPWEPIGGAASALAGTIGSLMMGVADFPMELVNLFSKKPRTTADIHEDEAVPSASSTLTEGHDPPERTSRNRPQASTVSQSGSSEQPVTMESAIGAGKSIARIVDAGMKSPMDFTLALAKGFHNAPKLYGDQTVRSVDKVTDLRSGLKAATKGLGYGFYDGISGLVTQPLDGARKDGVAGFMKGFGKGIGGVVLKPGAAIWGVPGYTFNGIYKEIRKLHGSSVRNYMIAARTAQGYDEWCNIAEEERLDIIRQWKGANNDKEPGTQKQRSSHGARSGMTKTMTDYSQGSTTPSAPERSLDEGFSAEYERAIRDSIVETSRGNAEEDAMVENAIRTSLAELERRRPAADDDNEAVAAAIAASLAQTTPSVRDRGHDAGSGTSLGRQAAKDNPEVDSDDDENMKAALKLSHNDA